jgi:hypothetical protein
MIPVVGQDLAELKAVAVSSFIKPRAAFSVAESLAFMLFCDEKAKEFREKIAVEISEEIISGRFQPVLTEPQCTMLVNTKEIYKTLQMKALQMMESDILDDKVLADRPLLKAAKDIFMQQLQSDEIVKQFIRGVSNGTLLFKDKERCLYGQRKGTTITVSTVNEAERNAGVSK